MAANLHRLHEHPRLHRRATLDAVEADGKVCISILHAPGIDAFNEYESADERWRPIIGIEQVLVSVMAMLGDPNIASPANVDAAVSCFRVLMRRNGAAIA